MESNNRTQVQDQQSDHRHDMKSRYAEPESDSPYQYNQEGIDQQSKASRYNKTATQTGSGENRNVQPFPESGVNRDQRGLPSSPSHRTPAPPDEKIREIITDRLSDDPSIDFRDINVIVQNGTVILTGTVDSDQSRKSVESFVEQTPGIRHAENKLKIRPASEDQD
jgi:osmotically-inducible protein OsmY